jgi:hypothetical protein
MKTTKIAVFRGQGIRRSIHNNEWWFVVEDVVSALTDSKDPKQYINKMRRRDPQLAEGWVQFVHTLSIETPGGPQKVNCANTEGVFRIIQSIPSPKAEPFKRWLARVGYERVQEIEDPELGTKRTRALYKAKGYSDGWIEKRMRGIAIREELTEEWEKRGVQEETQYAILTAEISKATFGLTPSQYKKLKGLKRENLRDHFSDLEQIFRCLARPLPLKSPATKMHRASMKAKPPHRRAATSPERPEKTSNPEPANALSQNKTISRPRRIRNSWNEPNEPG